MVYKPKYKKRYPRNKTNKYSKVGKRTYGLGKRDIMRPKRLVISDEARVKLPYTMQFHNGTTGDTSAEQLTWRLNSIHDPNHTYTGTGNRAQGYDQWSTFYDK
ncbi:hypothetical protein, partial [Nocardia mangyaensis]|uniref:hypothetical protein n=1 Tax=Nocardia mangyaensis TaxID=2213200 RepID=UPI002674D164